MREELGNQTDTALPFKLAIVLRLALPLLYSVSTVTAGGQGHQSTRFTSLDFTNSDTISLDLLSPFTLHQTGRGRIPLLTVAGADTDIPLAIRPKGNSFLQLGPDTFGASGWAGFDVITEILSHATATSFSYGNYIEMHAGDFAAGSVIGTSMWIYSDTGLTNAQDQLIGLDINVFPTQPSGHTLRQGVGTQSQTESYNDGRVTNAYGVAGYVTAKDNSHIDIANAFNAGVTSTETGSITTATGYFASMGNVSTNAGENGALCFLGVPSNNVLMGALYGLYFTDFTGHATTGFYEFFDAPGVFSMKDDGVANYYNPSFTHYTVGASNYERSALQWNSNVLEFGAEAGGTGTLRGVKMLGARLQTPDLTAPTLRVVPQSSPPASPSEGMIYGNSSDHHLYYYNGSAWKQLDN